MTLTANKHQKMIKPQPIYTGTSLHKPNNKTPVNVDSVEAMTPEKDRMVTGVFVNIEYPGQPAKVCGRYYRGMQYFEKVFEDGERATIPLSVARTINEMIAYDEHSYLIDEAGNPIKSGKKRYRYKFHSESF